jgi:hypothetical protein
VTPKKVAGLIIVDTADPDTNLFRSVVMQAIQDCLSPNVGIRGQVIRWLASPDFEEICDLSGLTGEKLKPLFGAVLLSKGAKARYLAGKLKSYVYFGTLEVV